jgi:hypothetical protein
MNETPRDEELVDAIVELAPHIQVAHHVAGRIRLKILPVGVELLKRRRRESNSVNSPVEHLPGVRKLRTNVIARSVVLEYDEGVLTNDLWTALELARIKPNHTGQLRALLLAALRNDRSPAG